MTWWYISFAMSKKQGGFRGATVVEGKDAQSALANATMRGLNPGGEAAILEVYKEDEQKCDVLALRNTLLDKEQMLAMRAVRSGDMPKKIKRRWEAATVFVCSTCNATSCTCH